MIRIKSLLIFIPLLIINSFCFACLPKVEKSSQGKGSYYSGEYQNLFKDLLGKNESEIKNKLNAAFNQFFYGDDNSQRIYYPVGSDMGYIKDVLNNDVRSEGMSYGMMISVQLDKKNEFDRIWKWAKTFMQHKSGKRENYFAWHCRTDGSILDSNSASDGEEWFVTSFYFASARWGNGDGIFNYKAEAQKILDAMISKVEKSDDPKVITNMFNKDEKKVVFVPAGEADDFTDPSYHLPHFYELWGKWADKNNRFWLEAADTSREYLKRTINSITGLAPDYSKFDGTPFSPWNGGTENFQYDAWRVAMNVAIDYEWFAKDSWEVFQSNRLLNFFYTKGIKEYGACYTLDGKKLSDDHSVGLISMNAVAALASTNLNRKEFVEELWNSSFPSGTYRYYDGILQMIGLLQVSGNFRIYDVTCSSLCK